MRWAIVFMALVLTGCGTTRQAPIPTGVSFCQAYKPTTWHASDTRATKAQIDSLNRQWKRLCRRSP